MNTKTPFAVIFDMDGVLIDSTKHIWDSFNIMLEPKRFRFNATHIKKYLGNSLRDQVLMWKADHGIDVGDYKEFSAKANVIQLELMGKSLIPNANLLHLLQELKKKKVPMAVGTASQRPRAEKMLDLFGIRDYFEVLVTANDIEKHKPNPEVFLKAAEELGIAPERCVVIEDAGSGIQAAKNGGMKAVGFLTEWNDREELSGADALINGFADISYERLRNLFG